MGRFVSTALTAGLNAELHRVYGWVGTLLLMRTNPLQGALLQTLYHLSWTLALPLAVLVLAMGAASGRPSEAVFRLVVALVGTLAARPLGAFLVGLNQAAIAAIGTGLGTLPGAAPGGLQSIAQWLVFGLPYLLLLAMFSLILIVRTALLVMLIAVAPLVWNVSALPLFERLRVTWLWQLLTWSLLPSAEAYLLAATRGLAGQLPVATPAADMLSGLVIIYLMVRMPMQLMRLQPWSWRL